MSIVGLVAILLSLLYIKQKEMLVRLCLLIFMICLYFFPFAYSFFNGLSAMQPRWIYMLIFTCGMVAAYAIDFDKRIQNIVTSI
ncbi:YfhO family protein [Priestia megaterium]